MPAPLSSIGPDILPQNWIQAVHEADAERVLQCFAEDCHFEDVALGLRADSRAEFAEIVRAWFTAMTDWDVESADVIYDGTRAAVRWTASATYSAPAPGFPAHAKLGVRVPWNVVSLQAFDENGFIKTHYDYYNLQELLAPLNIDSSELVTERAADPGGQDIRPGRPAGIPGRQ